MHCVAVGAVPPLGACLMRCIAVGAVPPLGAV